MKKIFGQSERRIPMKLTDQYGRKWETTWDVIGKGPCAPINPAGFHDPLGTPQKFLRTFPDEPGRLEVLHAEWVRERKEAMGDWTDRLHEEARRMSPETGGTALLGNDPPATCKPALLSMVGKPPQPYQPVEAAMMGNKYCLGLTDKMPTWAIPYFKTEEESRTKYLDAEDEEPGQYDDESEEGGFAAQFKVEGVEVGEGEEAVERLLDLEEQYDPDATGGKAVPVKRSKKTAVVK